VIGTSAQQHWILRPLVEAGLTRDEMSTLLFRLAFDSSIDPARPSALDLQALVGDRSVHVRRAWLEVLDRMTSGPAGAEARAETPPSRNQPARTGAFPTEATG
jgi:hypothetical protein